VRHDAVQPLAQIRATPLAQLDRLREVMLVWFQADHPAAPASLTGDDTKTGNAMLQPQKAPAKPSPTPAPPAAPAGPAQASTASPNQ
jgi:hypothetical protein